MIHRIHPKRFIIHGDVSSLPVPTTSSDGRSVVKAAGAFVPDRLVLLFRSGDVEAIIQGPVQVYSYDATGDRWYSAGIINDGNSIDAVAGFEDEIPWLGGDRIAIVAPGIDGSGGLAVTVEAIPVEVR